MITQTSDGYIWIAVGGLLRFDGVTMTPVLPQKSFPTDAGINWLLGSRDGSLWMATYHGLYRLKDGEAFGLPIKRGGVESILEDHDGAIWITRTRVGGTEGALCRIAGNDLKCYAKDKSDGNPAYFATVPCRGRLRRHLVRMPDAMPLEREFDKPLHARADGSSIR